MGKEKKPTQKDELLNWFITHNSIDQLQAFNNLGIMRLAPRICELQKMGYCFEKHNVTFKTRLGRSSFYTKYELVKG